MFKAKFVVEFDIVINTCTCITIIMYWEMLDELTDKQIENMEQESLSLA